MKENKIIKVFSLVVVVHMALVAMLVLQPGCNTVSGSGKTAKATPVGNPYDSGLWDSGPVQESRSTAVASRQPASSRVLASSAAKQTRSPVREEIVDLSGVPEFETASVYSEHNQHYSYTVKAGDSVWKIANSNGVSMRKLMEMNNLKENSRIHPGQTLMIPGVPEASVALAQLEVPSVKQPAKTTPSSAVASNETRVEVANTRIPELKAPAKSEPVRETVLASVSAKPSSADIPMEDSEGIYEVQPGDSLYLIAMHNNTSVEKIRELNGMEKNLIKPGQKLRIPGKYQGAPVVASAPETVSSFEVAFNDVPVERGSSDHMTHEVAPGEYPGLIARKYNMSLTDLLELNNIQNPRMLRVGTKLKVINPEAMMQRTEVAAEATQGRESSVASTSEKTTSEDAEASSVSTINFDDFPVIRVGS